MFICFKVFSKEISFDTINTIYIFLNGVVQYEKYDISFLLNLIYRWSHYISKYRAIQFEELFLIWSSITFPANWKILSIKSRGFGHGG